MMMHPTLLTLLVLLCMAFALVWRHLLKPCAYRPREERAVLLTLAAAFALSTMRPSPAATAESKPWLFADGLGRIATALLLGAMALRLMRQSTRSLTSADRTVQAPLALLAACGGVATIGGANLAVLLVGASLYALAESLRPGNMGRHRWIKMLSLGILAFGVALLYMGTASLQYRMLSQRLWEWIGPQSLFIYVGAACSVAGLCITFELLPLTPAPYLNEQAPTTLVGMAALAHLCLYGLGALSHAWQLALLCLSLVNIAAGGLHALSTRGASARLRSLAHVQNGLLFWALALAPTFGGYAAWVMLLLSSTLGQALCGVIQPSSVADGTARFSDWLHAPAIVGLLALAGAPGTAGWVAHVQMLWVTLEGGMLWLAAMGVATVALSAIPYLRAALDLMLSDAPEQAQVRPSLTLALSCGLACAGLLAAGLWPSLVLRLLP